MELHLLCVCGVSVSVCACVYVCVCFLCVEETEEVMGVILGLVTQISLGM